MHLADAFIQSDFQCIQVILFFFVSMCSLGIEPTTFCAANAMLYNWATGTLLNRALLCYGCKRNSISICNDEIIIIFTVLKRKLNVSVHN